MPPRPASLKLEDDQHCYVCGSLNKAGLHLCFDHPQKGLLRATVIFDKHHQGFNGIVHGGFMAMVLDEMIVNLAWKEAIPAVTGELRVRLKQAARIGQKILLEGRIEAQEGRLLRGSALAKDERGEVIATAEATCVKIKLEPAPKPS